MSSLVRRPDRRMLIAGAGAVGLAALSRVGQVAVPPSLRPQTFETPSLIDGRTYPIQVHDPLGLVQTVSKPPQRIISTMYPSDEILMQIVDQSRVVAVPKTTDQPAISNAAFFYDKRVYRHQSRLEEMIQLQPDFIILRDITPATTVKVLIQSGINVARFAFYDSFAGIDRNVRDIAAIMGVQAKAEVVLRDMWDRLTAVRQAVRTAYKPRLLWYSNRGSNTGVGTLNHEMIDIAGARNVVAELGRSGYVKLPVEAAIALMPEVIVVDAWPTGEIDVANLLRSPAWKDVPAIRNKRIHVLNSAWATTGTPIRVKGVEQLAKALHPDRFAG